MNIIKAFMPKKRYTTEDLQNELSKLSVIETDFTSAIQDVMNQLKYAEDIKNVLNKRDNQSEDYNSFVDKLKTMSFNESEINEIVEDYIVKTEKAVEIFEKMGVELKEMAKKIVKIKYDLQIYYSILITKSNVVNSVEKVGRFANLLNSKNDEMDKTIKEAFENIQKAARQLEEFKTRIIKSKAFLNESDAVTIKRSLLNGKFKLGA